MIALELINKFYPENTPLKRLLLHHSKQVAYKALCICRKHPELRVNKDLLVNGALIHDIGIFLTNAPGIHCLGSEPYLAHGVLGGKLAREAGYPQLARFCERHTGTGLTADNVRENHLPIPTQDYLPETEEEQIVCYADKFYSKSHLLRVRTVDETIKSLEKYGPEGVEKFKRWAERYE